MKRLWDFLPAFFCTVYLEKLVFLLYSMAEGPTTGGLGYVGPPIGLLLAIFLFSRWRGFWRRFSRFTRCLLLVLATVGMAIIPMGILVGVDWGSSNHFDGVLASLVFSVLGSIVWFPLALLISGLYCLPLWAWEGRNNPNHLAGKLILGFPTYRLYLLLILPVGFVLLLGFYWHRQPASPLWVNAVAGDGYVFSLASGKAPDGTEVVLAGGYYRSDQSGNDLHIVSLEARNGHLRWVVNYQRPLPNMSKQPLVVTDPVGDVLVGWNYWAAPRIPYPVISKLSGSDGRLLWERQVDDGQTLAANLSAPIPDGLGRIWITGIQKGRDGYWNRVLALLDERDGTSHWETVAQQISHISTEPAPNTAQVFPLKDGDAFATFLPYDDNDYVKTPGSMQRISGKDGSTLWKLDYPAWIENYIVEAIPLVDEAHQQVVIFFRSAPQRGKIINIISYDLLTGKERWHSVDPAGEDPWSLAASLDDAGNLVLWRSDSEQIAPKSWSNLLPWTLFPNGEVSRQMKSVREVFSSVDGTLLGSQPFAESSERPQAIVSRPGSNQADTVILRRWNEKDQVLPWRAVFLNRSRQNVLSRLPGGPEAGLHFPSHVVLTPSGRLVIAGPFGKDIRKWEIALW